MDIRATEPHARSAGWLVFEGDIRSIAARAVRRTGARDSRGWDQQDYAQHLRVVAWQALRRTTDATAAGQQRYVRKALWNAVRRLQHRAKTTSEHQYMPQPLECSNPHPCLEARSAISRLSRTPDGVRLLAWALSGDVRQAYPNEPMTTKRSTLWTRLRRSRERMCQGEEQWQQQIQSQI